MPLPLISTVSKYIDTGPKNPSLLDSAAKRWSKIALHVSSKTVAIATEFIVAVAVFKDKVAPSNIGKLTLASKKIMGHCKSGRLNVIYKSGISFVVISACS